MSKVFNFNIGILGHVDSGKTSIAKVISQTASTAAFDKHPESQRRGVTIDLGFSSFQTAVDDQLRAKQPHLFGQYERIQYTLVDCPGHSSLLRTVIGGSQIVDLILLVVDVTKGIQAQTAECVVLADIMCPGRMVVALNKVDLLPEAQDQPLERLKRVERRIRKALHATSFHLAPVVPMSTVGPASAEHVEAFLKVLVDQVYVPERRALDEPFLFFVDHCFTVKGRGTVMTGTVVSGRIGQGSAVDIPACGQSRPVKSIQVFHKSVQSVGQGDRAAICLNQLDRLPFERGLICQKGAVKAAFASLCSVHKVAYFKYPLQSRSSFHISVGYELITCKCYFFSCAGGERCGCHLDGDKFNFDSAYSWLNDVADVVERDGRCHVYALAHFDHAVHARPCRYVASKLDIDAAAPVCRIAFHGRALHLFHDKDFNPKRVDALKVYKTKCRSGVAERLVDERSLIVRNMFSNSANVTPFLGCKISLSTGETGFVDRAFGQSGKATIRLTDGLGAAATQQLHAKSNDLKVQLHFRRLTFREDKRIVQ